MTEEQFLRFSRTWWVYGFLVGAAVGLALGVMVGYDLAVVTETGKGVSSER